MTKLNRKINRRVRRNIKIVNGILTSLRKVGIYIYDNDDIHWYLDEIKLRDGVYCFDMREKHSSAVPERQVVELCKVK